MIVYHASSVIVDNPDTNHSRSYLDFGPGFYLTYIKDQAIKYAQRFSRRGKNAILNIYELSEDFSQFNVKVFENYDEFWLDFVTECRSGNIVGDYDIIIGGIANDKVFRTVDLYYAGDISKEECLKRLIYETPNNQICIRNQKVLDDCITFKYSIEL